MANETDTPTVITRREAVWRVSAMLGGVALVGGTSLLTACERGERPAGAAADGSYQAVGQFTADQVALLDEIADTILPTTPRSPGAKAAATGPFMALMVTDAYRAPEQQVFRDGLTKVDEATKRAHGVGFMQAAPAQRLAVLTALDRDAKTYMDARFRAQEAAAARGQKVEQGPQAPPEGTAVIRGKEAAGDSADKNLSDQRQENAGTGEIAGGVVAADAPAHYFRMMKELAMLGYFTSEIGCTKAQRYVESPGRYEPCAPYAPGQPAWAPHA
jgi:hypothetical protein